MLLKESNILPFLHRSGAPRPGHRRVKWLTKRDPYRACLDELAESPPDPSGDHDADYLASIDKAFVDAAAQCSGRIEMHPGVLRGVPCISGTRVPVYAILELLEDGFSHKRILKWFPQITKDDLKAAIRFAALVMER